MSPVTIETALTVGRAARRPGATADPRAEASAIDDTTGAMNMARL
jgi:hypothetical protein